MLHRKPQRHSLKLTADTPMTQAILSPQYTHAPAEPRTLSDLPLEAENDDSENIRCTQMTTANSCLVQHWLLFLLGPGHPGGSCDSHCSDLRAELSD